MKDYNKLIQNKVDSSFNRILVVTCILAFTASVFLFMADLPIVYGVMNFGTGIILLVYICFAKKIQTYHKIYVLVFVMMVISVASFIGGSFTSAFFSILTAANIIGLFFLPRKQGTLISAVSVAIMGFMAYYSVRFPMDLNMKTPGLTWSLQITGFALLLAVINISSYSIKNYLIENIQSLEKSMVRSNKLAYYDQLTGLPNTYKFMDDVAAAIDEHHSDGCIVILNLRSLGIINSTLGKDFGDQILVEFSKLFSISKREGDIFARTGGNEFALWIGETSEEQMQKSFEMMVEAFDQRHILNHKKIGFFGVYADFRYGKDEFSDVFRKAEVTLTYAKKHNLQGLIPYNDELESILKRTEAVKDKVEEAIHKGEITLFYQAKHDSRNGEVIGLEALARWSDEKLGNVSPYEFIPVIESLNLSVSFGEFVIKKACRDYYKLQKKYNEAISVSVNISPSHIIDASIISTVENALNTYGVPTEKLILEITEDIIIKGIDEVRPILKALRDLKVRISLDDFGSGYSALNYINKLELDEIKIDKTFVDQIDDNPQTRVLLESILLLAKELKLDTVAEGVETSEQNELLKELGCYIIQGYYFAKPEAL